ncbi:MAG TPA: NAD(P)H-binding protein [Roseiarcus sp.]|nr:NAD(P)H-binding protein [Roseiarcus sp.]
MTVAIPSIVRDDWPVRASAAPVKTGLPGSDRPLIRIMYIMEPSIEAVKDSGVKRYFVVGGAGSLEVAPGVKLIDTPQFPAAHKAEAAKGGEFLDLLRRETTLDWAFLSPSAMVGPGERTGKFRLGKDQLLTNEKGSSISWEDYAIAAVDELEKPAHIRQRFTVGY